MNKQKCTYKVKAIMAVLFTGLIISCNSNDFLEGSQTNSQSQSPLSETAIKFVKSINKNEITRFTSQSIGVKSISEFPLSKEICTTRSAENFPKFYAISMNNNQGTVILSENNNNIKPLAYFMKYNYIDVNKIMQDTISDLAFIIKSAIEDNLEPTLETRSSQENDFTIEEKVEPKCKVYWHQGYPYNTYCFTSNGKQAKAGCVAIAGAQAATVLRPMFYIISSWDEIIKPYPTAKATDEIARMIAYIGDKVDMDYGTESSGAHTKKLTPIFNKYGIKDYDAEHAIDVLNTEHGVVVVSGYKFRLGWLNRYYIGHAFLADGYIKYKNSDDPYYLHLNYGWFGKPGNAYLLTSKKNWKEDKSMSNSDDYIFRHKIYYYSYAYESEKNW